jgi:hypothetical protein
MLLENESAILLIGERRFCCEIITRKIDVNRFGGDQDAGHLRGSQGYQPWAGMSSATDRTCGLEDFSLTFLTRVESVNVVGILI